MVVINVLNEEHEMNVLVHATMYNTLFVMYSMYLIVLIFQFLFQFTLFNPDSRSIYYWN